MTTPAVPARWLAAVLAVDLKWIDPCHRAEVASTVVEQVAVKVLNPSSFEAKNLTGQPDPLAAVSAFDLAGKRPSVGGLVDVLRVDPGHGTNNTVASTQRNPHPVFTSLQESHRQLVQSMRRPVVVAVRR